MEQSAQILLVSQDRTVRKPAPIGSALTITGRLKLSAAPGRLWTVRSSAGPDLIVLDLMPNEFRGLVSAALAAPCASRSFRPGAGCRWRRQSEDGSASPGSTAEFLVRPLHPQQLEAAIQRSLFHYSESTESEIVADEIEQIGEELFFVAASPTMKKLRAQAERWHGEFACV